MLSTPGTLFDFLNLYDRVPKNRLRVFFATSMDFMNAMLVRENSGLLSNSITVEQFLKSRKRIDGQNIKQLESELDLQLKRIDGQNIKQLESELDLQLNTGLVARSVITRKLGDECSSLQATSSFESANSVTSEARGSNRESNLLRLMREESEWGRGGDYDTPYTFALPVYMPQALAWTRLLAKIQRGELAP